MTQLVLLSMVCAFWATTIAEMRVFKSLRSVPKIGALFHCGYCLSFWIALALVGCLRPSTGIWTGPVGFVVDWFLVAWMAGVQCLLARMFIRLADA